MPSTQPSQSINFVLSVHMRSSPPLTLLKNHKLDHVFGEKKKEKRIKEKKGIKNIGLFPESNRGHLYPKQVFYH